ncbi:uncharacterized protein LOC123498537 isoform X2 [Portunus trituberculatus]|uniref:uncharacterized protein LOC123498537 isoform X2 n=1 Tax=Portunus trituberculatus TaxID=210409 RepID=UPI001E1CEC33|nr:uncharacterized protein LOC123498537 isoform X2 [Portunus trituberculatus]
MVKMFEVIHLLPVIGVMVATLSCGGAAGQAALLSRVTPLAATLLKYGAEPLLLQTTMVNNPRHQRERRQTTAGSTLEADISEAINTISSEELQGDNLRATDLTQLAESSNSIHNHLFSGSSIHKGDIVPVPYDDLGWFSKTVELAMDGSLYVGLAIGVMFIAGTLLSGAIGLFGDTCLICSFIGYANTVAP